ncbi:MULTISPECIES: hypothetical protein [Mycobacteroides]|uniref:hypothetical protein n=1 Tax=Mycobacteroides TaxID=670516 RepID=UPI001041E4E7|nr:hypothetical protein [Mycobacteroides abscessus]
MALTIGIGASHKLEVQNQAHKKKLAKLRSTAERVITTQAEELLTQGFREGFKQAEITYGQAPKPRGKKRKAHA